MYVKGSWGSRMLRHIRLMGATVKLIRLVVMCFDMIMV
jgi:hypothetical protein